MKKKILQNFIFSVFMFLLLIAGLMACSSPQSSIETSVVSTLSVVPTSTIIITQTFTPTAVPSPTVTPTDIPKFNPDRKNLGLNFSTLKEELKEYGFEFQIAPIPVFESDPPMENEYRYIAENRDGKIYVKSILDDLIYASYSMEYGAVQHSKLSLYDFSAIILGTEVFEKTIESDTNRRTYCIDGIAMKFTSFEDTISVIFTTKEDFLYEIIIIDCE